MFGFNNEKDVNNTNEVYPSTLEENINKDLINCDINDTMFKIEALYHAMDSLAKISYLYGSWYISIFKIALNITCKNNQADNLDRIKLLTFYNSHTKILNESIGANEDGGFDFIYRSDKLMVEIGGMMQPLVLTASGIGKAFMDFNDDIGFMIRDFDTTRWKGRYFSIIETDLLNIINEIDSYRIDISNGYLQNYCTLKERKSIKINGTKSIYETVKYILKEMDALFKECAAIIKYLAANNSLENPIIVDENANKNIVRQVVENEETGEITVEEMPDDF